MSQEERRRVADHLTTCRDCAEEYRLATEVGAFADRDPLGTSRQISHWPGFVPASRLLPAYAIAASLLIAVAGFGAWVYSLRTENRVLTARVTEAVRRGDQSEQQVGQLRQTVEALSQPIPNVTIADLEPDVTRGPPRPAKTIELPSRGALFVLVLNITDARPYRDYALEVLDQNGKTVWAGAGLARSPDNTFTLALPTRLFPEGAYRLRLLGVDSARRDLLVEYPVRVKRVPR